MKQTDPQFKVRLPEAVMTRVKAVAASSRRTVTSQIVVLLERALPSAEQETKAAIEAGTSTAAE